MKRLRVISSLRGRIHKAIPSNHIVVIWAFLAFGADVDELDSSGGTPLAHATFLQREALCKLLLQSGASTHPEILRKCSFRTADLVASVSEAVRNRDVRM